MAEKWLPVVGYEGVYEVSDLGNVRSIDRVLTDGHRRVGRVLKKIPDKKGYLLVNLSWSNRARIRFVHQLVLESFSRPKRDGEEALHWDDVPWNNTAANLRWGTRTENLLDRSKNGLDHNRNKTRCPRGHLLSSPNLTASKLKLGHRNCLACSKEFGRSRHAGVEFSVKVSNELYGKIMEGVDDGVE